MIERQVTRAVRLQRQDQQAANDTSRKTLAGHGLAFNEVDTAPFRAQLVGRLHVVEEDARHQVLVAARSRNRPPGLEHEERL